MTASRSPQRRPQVSRASGLGAVVAVCLVLIAISLAAFGVSALLGQHYVVGGLLMAPLAAVFGAVAANNFGRDK